MSDLLAKTGYSYKPNTALAHSPIVTVGSSTKAWRRSSARAPQLTSVEESSNEVEIENDPLSKYLFGDDEGRPSSRNSIQGTPPLISFTPKQRLSAGYGRRAYEVSSKLGKIMEFAGQDTN